MRRKGLDKIPWINELKIGDSVVVISNSKRLEKVTGVSKKSVFVGDIQFSKFTGTMHTKYRSWDPPKIEQATKEITNAFEKERLDMLDIISNIDFYTLEHKDVKVIYGLLKRVKSLNLENNGLQTS